MTTNAYMASRWPAASYRLVQAVDDATTAIQYQAERYRLGELSKGEFEQLCICSAALAGVNAAIDCLGRVNLREVVKALDMANRSVAGMTDVPGMPRVYGALRDVALAAKATVELPAA